MYHGDDGYKQNIEKAVALLDSGVSQKSIISMRRRADIYLKDGDVEQATELLKDAGNIEAVYYLACIYEGGYTIPRNIDLSVRLYKKAAENGDVKSKKDWVNLGYAPAMMNYGYMCASGDGIRKNLDDGLFWFLSAIENGEENGRSILYA